MENILQNINIDWITLLTTVWTVILVPIGKAIYEWLKSNKLDKYADILYKEVLNAVKGVHESIVKDIKGTDRWDEETKTYVRELAKTKALQALTTTVYKCLKEANSNFDEYLDSLIDSALFDIKNDKNVKKEE